MTDQLNEQDRPVLDVAVVLLNRVKQTAHLVDKTGITSRKPYESSGSGAELRTLDYENPGSNPVLHVKTLDKFFSLYIAPVHSAE